MHRLHKLLENNQKWSENITREDPQFFQRLSEAQTPEYLWIGCSDSRVPANEIVGLLPGEIFVHRNIANLVVHTDFNCMSVIEFSVAVLKVKHIIVCGHYGCGGVKAALENTSHGLIDNWLYSIKNLYYRNKHRFESLASEEDRHNYLCELNVKQQVKNVAHSHVVQKAWENGQDLTVHGWIYSLKDGMVNDLKYSIHSQADLADEYRVASPNKEDE
ncbi:carbonate dehydratase [Ketobacter sp. MCCC 1A13808]|uniref:carbonate dehydratase n=1 Tax=Ketobacter sp. MCCC 1A13808 TaxID=2602738 RepID=UPI000F20F674|nr:carbonate dehydratase [Ketobacter sp. MCCC 1A13808]MVF10853.1 carbonate dehydratase [Ketobacter sp. MCCC 1A13808]RLP56252.1 MAG: carbonate dehydratase [Ketobacter sp.]